MNKAVLYVRGKTYLPKGGFGTLNVDAIRVDSVGKRCGCPGENGWDSPRVVWVLYRPGSLLCECTNCHATWLWGHQ